MAKRDFSGVSIQAKEHKNSKGCKVVEDLDQLIADGTLLDDAILVLERQYKMTMKLEPDEVKQANTNKQKAQLKNSKLCHNEEILKIQKSKK